MQKNWAIVPPVTLRSELYGGEWQEKYWKNIPGPIYSTNLNMISGLASSEMREHALCDDHCEFMWRQPSTAPEFERCLSAIECDEVNSFQVDGNNHWKSQGVRAWWKQRNDLLRWAKYELSILIPGERYLHGVLIQPDRRPLTEYINFLEKHAEEYLRSYLFLLDQGREALVDDKLPEL